MRSRCLLSAYSTILDAVRSPSSSKKKRASYTISRVTSWSQTAKFAPICSLVFTRLYSASVAASPKYVQRSSLTSKSKIKLLINTFLKQNSDRLISQDEITNLFSSSSLPPYPQDFGFVLRFRSEGPGELGGLQRAERFPVHARELGRRHLLRSASLNRVPRADVQREGAAIQARAESKQPETALGAAKLAAKEQQFRDGTACAVLGQRKIAELAGATNAKRLKFSTTLLPCWRVTSIS